MNTERLGFAAQQFNEQRDMILKAAFAIDEMTGNYIAGLVNSATKLPDLAGLENDPVYRRVAEDAALNLRLAAGYGAAAYFEDQSDD